MTSSAEKPNNVTQNELHERAHGSTGNSLAKKNLENLLTARSQQAQHGDISSLVRDRHRKNHEDVEPRHEGDQSNKNGGDQFFQMQGAEQRPVLFHPRCDRKSLAYGMLDFFGDFSGAFRLNQTEFQHIDQI